MNPFKNSKYQSVILYSSLILLFLIAYLIRILFLEEALINPDEARIISKYTRASFEEIVLQYWTGNQVFHSIIVHFASYISTTPFFLRYTTATLFGILSIPIIYQTAKKLFNPYVALISVIFLVLSAYQIYNARIIRGYSLIVFLSTLSTLILYQILTKQKVKLWPVFIVASVLNIYTHLFTVGLTGAHALMIAWFWRAKRRTITPSDIRNPILALTATGLLTGILYSPLVLQIISVQSNEDVFESDFSRLFEVPLNQHFVDFGQTFSIYLTFGEHPYWMILLLIVIAAGLIHMIKNHLFEAGWLIIWIIGPYIIALTALNIVPGFYLGHRFLQFVIPPLLILLAYSAYILGDYVYRVGNFTNFLRTQQNLAFSYIIPVIGFVLLFGCLNANSYIEYNQKLMANDWHRATQYLLKNASPNDLILCEEFNKVSYTIAKDIDVCTRNIKHRLEAKNLTFFLTTPDSIIELTEAIATSPFLLKSQQVWLVRWDLPKMATPTDYDPVFSATKDKRIDIIATEKGVLLKDGLLQIASTRTHFEEEPLNQAIRWIQLAQLQMIFNKNTSAKTSLDQAEAFKINDPNFQEYLDSIKRTLVNSGATP